MQWKILCTVLLVVVSFTNVNAVLNCYKCNNTAECLSGTVTKFAKETCKENESCGTMLTPTLADKNVKFTTRGCWSTLLCSDPQAKTKFPGVDCVECKADLCNASNTIMLSSVIAISTLVSVSLLKYFY